MRFQPVISSHHNETFKSAMRLHQATERREQCKFLIEGTHSVEEAIATGWPLESIWFEETWAEQNRQLLDGMRSDSSRCRVLLQPATMEILHRLSTTSSRSPVVGIANHPQRAE
ncbi:MAG TPA: RNA methyltransferase substrate-binding domain-containing protein, partial [Pirellula sp.]|nr:RNA methyltransferase substrate-binding domain-containing protein [Pirellula sp.]